MKKILFLLTCLSSLAISSELKSNINYERGLKKGMHNNLTHKTNLELDLPYDLVFKANLSYSSDFDFFRFKLIEDETGVGITKKFGKYGDLSLDAKLDKKIRLGYHNRYQLNEKNKLFGGIELEKKMINKKRGLQWHYQRNGQNAKFDNQIHYDLMSNSGKVYLGLEHNSNLKLGKVKAKVELNDIIQYDNIKTDYKEPLYYTLSNGKDYIEKEAHKKVFSNQTNLDLNGEMNFKETPINIKGEAKNNLFIGRFDGDYKQDVLEFKTNIKTSVDYEYKKDKLMINPEFIIKNDVIYSETTKYGLTYDKIFKSEDEIKVLRYNLKLEPVLNAKYEISKGFELNGKLGVNFNFDKLETKLNNQPIKNVESTINYNYYNYIKNNQEELNKEYHKDFGFNGSNAIFGIGLKYTW